MDNVLYQGTEDKRGFIFEHKLSTVKRNQHHILCFNGFPEVGGGKKSTSQGEVEKGQKKEGR